MVRMIGTFIQYLPDMDIVLNENDECRVVIPWEIKQQLLTEEQESRPPATEQTFLNSYPATQWLGPLLSPPLP